MLLFDLFHVVLAEVSDALVIGVEDVLDRFGLADCHQLDRFL